MDTGLNEGSGVEYELGAEGRLFPESAQYRKLLDPAGGRVCERSVPALVFPFTERHLQCVWHDPNLCPARLRTTAGEPVRVEHAGQWNLVAGPDFLGAVLRVGSRRLHGDVEIHVQPEDWHRHNHAGDPRYGGVIAHVTWFPGPLPSRTLPPGAVEISLQGALQRNPLFSFEQIDVTAYPYQTRGRQTPCGAILAGWDRAGHEALLVAAGEERLRRRSEVLRRALHERGIDQVFYEEMMRVLGYHQNKIPFHCLARQVPLALLTGATEGETVSLYAVLLALTGRLPEPAAEWDPETQAFVRGLWDRWWRLRERFEGIPIPTVVLRSDGIRPLNRPERRLMAAACLLSAHPEPARHWLQPGETRAAAFIRCGMRQLTSLQGTYWGHRQAWSAPRSAKPHALLGKARAAEALVNVLVPLAAAQGRGELFSDGLLRKLPATGSNFLIRRTAHALFGPDHAPSLYADSLRRQGLLQIFHDFCLGDRSGCLQCTFPAALVRERDEGRG